MKTILLETYQTRAVDWLKTKRRGMVFAPAGSGKTIIAAAALSEVVLSRVRTSPVKLGWMASTLEQCQQARAALDSFPDMIPLIEPTIACAAAETDWSDRHVLVVDEVHHSPAPQWRKQVESCPNARWGFTATPFGDDLERNEILRVMFDHQMFSIVRSEVSIRLSPARVIMLDATDPGLQGPIDAAIEHEMSWRIKYWKGDEWKLRAIISWQTCIKRGIIHNAARNQCAVELARRHSGDHVLMLVNEIEHGESLAKQIPGAVLCFSKMGKKARREALEAFKSGSINCLVATSLADEGLDLPIADVLILVSGGRSSAKTEQRTGRVLRAFAGKEYGTIYDFEDFFHSMMRRHSLKRQFVYRKLGYEIQKSTH